MGSAGVLGGIVFGAERRYAEANGGADHGPVVGTIATIESPAALQLRVGSRAVLVEFASGTTFWRDHPADLEDFLPGDLVALEGQWRNTRFVAEHMGSVYPMFEGRILQRRGDILQTTGGPVQLTMASRSRGGPTWGAKPLPDLVAGDEIVAVGRFDAEIGAFVALQIGVTGA